MKTDFVIDDVSLILLNWLAFVIIQLYYKHYLKCLYVAFFLFDFVYAIFWIAITCRYGLCSYQRILEPPSSWDQGVKGKLAMQSQYDWLKLGVSSECHRLWPKDVLSAHE